MIQTPKINLYHRDCMELMRDSTSNPVLQKWPKGCICQHGNIRLLHGDCMELLKATPDNHYSISIVDPPYGIGMGSNKAGLGRRKGDRKAKYKMGDWDSEVPTEEYFAELFRVSKNQIIWGGNYFQLPPTKCFLIWDKLFSNDVSFADCEFAWTSFNSTAKIFKKHPVEANRQHPTQKPVALYKWLLTNYANPGDRILDTHLGSMSIAIACFDLGFDLTGTELDKDYYDAGVARFERHRAQGQLFHAPAIQLPEQQKFF